MSDSLTLTFVDKKLLQTTLIDPDNAIHYTLTTTSGFRGKKITTITAASGLVGSIDWREKTFTINGVEKKWDDLKTRSAGVFRTERNWNWGPRPFNLKYQDAHKELLATPLEGTPADPVRFTVHRQHVLHDNEPATIRFPTRMQDDAERMFLLMAILHMEITRQETEKAMNEEAAEMATVGI
ncbi:hypothetical protein R3P38DRAFT_3560437 [Favolaschia claudopus]|uniref:DUF6593 domain-containing protein n=1 Tax=Favolaschia claudopus TaxID=2862362 RepID=A0AAW0AWS3_9AGAR